jgi:hypothetical protein
MEDSLWIEDIVESTTTPPLFFINFKVNMVGIVDPCKVVVRKSAFLALPIQMHEMEVKT